jgi:hypothetical protein
MSQWQLFAFADLFVFRLSVRSQVFRQTYFDKVLGLFHAFASYLP